MKKFYALLIAAAFVLAIIAPSFAASVVTTKTVITTTSTSTTKVASPNLMAQLKKLQATLKNTKAKNKRAALQKQINNLKARLKGRIAAEQKLIDQQKAAVGAPTPPPPPVAPVPPPAPVAVKAAPSAALFGWGLNTAWTGTYLNTGKGKINGALGAKAEVVLDDMSGLGGMVGLQANSVKWKVGLGGLYGADINGNRIKAIPVNFDGVVMLPAAWLGGISAYVGGGLNYTVYGSEQKAGALGAELYVGMLTDLGLDMGKTGLELGWAATRADGSTPDLSAKGLTLSVSQMLAL
jgi:hypothetical protein